MSEERYYTFTGANTFKAYGLTISSCIHCPELLPGVGAPQVSVVYGDVPGKLSGTKSNGVRYQAAPGQLLLEVDRVGRFQVRNGNEIVIERHPEASDDDVRLFLLGSAFGALLHQRGLVVLHGSTIKVGDACVVFLGRCGAGKSTLATLLRQRGYPCLGDDVCAISIGEDGVPFAAPAYPQAKLWVDTLQHLGIDATSLRRIRPSREKRALPLDCVCGEDRLPVKRLYVLSPDKAKQELLLGAVKGAPKCRVLRDYTYRVEYLQGLNLALDHFKQVAHLASRLPIIRVNRPSEQFGPDQLADAIEADFRSNLAAAEPLSAPLPSLFTETETIYV
jgi:hypothetical protein